ncbi:MAG: nucleoside deaminase [gamma proteobacterium symbiont of Bathyaustriella thionipta]|nr:nucleoside deaminase [gamma proteobacterium symbiont of Bathyaustriella thionipta]MCU7948616.1 nucleoside deaminase [gamma proteobacterium symbiont of Bathyaustriella thionipta]MCU7952879.1 nucleoside deaminase [gamma proteobacterium symbiont of Bathyaustriella thionipta]MCU7955133.1 nucleoside deaminase [gamma proteobacterium symbiont of Bathyaustriella thionipta]MCU7968879.1 nucleoside deaminase [gamma proteobacterium symbiont of Bathyaustriella thionipta]
MINKYISEAIFLARQSIDKHQGGPFGAIIVKDNHVIGRGTNQVTHHNDPTAHAEIEAIRDACRNIQSFSLEGCTLYTSSEPCPMCLSAIYWARIDTVLFANTYEQASQIGFDDQFIFKELHLAHKDKHIFISQIKDKAILNDAHDVFSAWEKSQSKQSY